MTHHSSPQAQRARRTLSQEAVKRSHRRCELIRLAPEDEPTPSSPHSASTAEPTDESALTSSPFLIQNREREVASVGIARGLSL